jgi:hypothetical protein
MFQYLMGVNRLSSPGFPVTRIVTIMAAKPGPQTLSNISGDLCDIDDSINPIAAAACGTQIDHEMIRLRKKNRGI